MPARARFGGDPLRIDHVHARTALALTDQLDDAAIQALRQDASSTAVGFGVLRSWRKRSRSRAMSAASW